MSECLKKLIQEVMSEEINAIIDRFYISGCNYERITGLIADKIRKEIKSTIFIEITCCGKECVQVSGWGSLTRWKCPSCNHIIQVKSKESER